MIGDPNELAPIALKCSTKVKVAPICSTKGHFGKKKGQKIIVCSSDETSSYMVRSVWRALVRTRMNFAHIVLL